MRIPSSYHPVSTRAAASAIVGQWVNTESSAVLTIVHVDDPAPQLAVSYELGRVRRRYPKALDAKRTMVVTVPGAVEAELMQLRSDGSQVSVLAAQAADGSVHVFKAACPVAYVDAEAEVMAAFFGSVALV